MRVHDNYDIYARRGDTHGVWVDLLDESSEETEVIPFEDGDVVKFSVKASPNDKVPVIQLVADTFEEGRANFEFQPSDTKGLAFDTYYYDVELVRVDGYTKTIIPPEDDQPLPQFVVTEEIT